MADDETGKDETGVGEAADPLTASDVLKRDVRSGRTIVFKAAPIIGWYLCAPSLWLVGVLAIIIAVSVVQFEEAMLGNEPVISSTVFSGVVVLIAVLMSLLCIRMSLAAFRQVREGDALHIGPSGVRVPGRGLDMAWDEIETITVRDWWFFDFLAILVVRPRPLDGRIQPPLKAFVGTNSVPAPVVSTVLAECQSQFGSAEGTRA